MTNIYTPPACPMAIVSRYEAFPALVQTLGISDDTLPVFTDPHPEDIRGFHVITDSINLTKAAFTSVVTVIPLRLPDDVDSLRAPLELLRRFHAKPQTYVVSACSAVQADQHKGGTTPAATRIAGAIVEEFRLFNIDASELADRIDSLLFDERKAGSETERLLLRMLTAAHGRHIVMEHQLLHRGASMASAPTNSEATAKPGQ